MKTQTRSTILKLIEKSGGIRPVELRQKMNLTVAMVHRHLRMLVQQGLIESQGSPPYTQYVPASTPNFEEAFRWTASQKPPKGPSEFVCESRDVFSARLPKLKSFVQKGLPENQLSVVISTTAEIGNNSFDHNLGQSRDIPGCWFETQIRGGDLWIYLADRGQGIFRSLTRVHPELPDEQAALQAAFEKIISGRAPEKRGNGLKYVKRNIAMTPGSGIACMSGKARIFYGEQGERCAGILGKSLTEVKGTATLIVWGLP